jgi:hypothetical protein
MAHHQPSKLLYSGPGHDFLPLDPALGHHTIFIPYSISWKLQPLENLLWCLGSFIAQYFWVYYLRLPWPNLESLGTAKMQFICLPYFQKHGVCGPLWGLTKVENRPFCKRASKSTTHLLLLDSLSSWAWSKIGLGCFNLTLGLGWRRPMSRIGGWAPLPFQIFE